MAVIINKRPYDYCMSGNPIMYELYSALAASNPDIYFEIKIRYTPTNNIFWADLVTFPVYPISGTAKIDLKDFLESFLSNNIPDFPVDEKEATAAINQTGYFYIQFREIIVTGTDPAWNNTEFEYYKFVMKAGLDYFKYRGDNFWINYFNGNNPFLTWQLSGRLAALDERMYLAFLNKTLLPSFTEAEETIGPALWAAVQVFYTDGTNSTVQYSNVPNYAKDIINFIPCGAAQWDLEALDGTKKIYYWKIRMEYTSSFINEKTALNDWFIFYADNRKDYNDITLHYRNSLGGIDSIRVRGVVEHNLNYKFDEQDKTFLPDYFSGKSISPSSIIANSREKLVYRGDVGHLEKEEQDRMRDMNLQRDCWWAIAEKWWPVNILTGNFKQKNSEDERWSFPIDFSFAAIDEKFYTPKTIELGDRTFETNVCDATITNVDIDVDTSGATAIATITFTVSAGLLVYQYQIPGVHTDPIEANVADLPLVITGLTKEEIFSIELRPICAGGIKGRKYIVPFNTITGGGGGGSGTLHPFTGSGYGSTEGNACSDASANNRTLWSECTVIAIACQIYATNDTLDPLLGYPKLLIDAANWDCDPATGIITGLSAIQC